MTEPTLSFADIARLARVQRPVVSMWRRRPVPGIPFPAQQPDGRFLADEVVAYLAATSRGNEPEPDLSVDLTTAASSATDRATRSNLLALLAARAVLGGDSIPDDPDTLVDDVEAIDPDDAWLFSEVAHADIAGLLARADAIADNSFSTADAFEQLRSRDAEPRRLSDTAVRTIADLAATLLGESGVLVDVAGGATDIALRVAADETRMETPILLVDDESARGSLRRYHVHGCDVHTRGIEDDWDLPSGSVVLIRVGIDPDSGVAEAMSAIDEASLQISPGTVTLAIGPAGILIDELPTATVASRDEILRRRLVEAAVRLPAGLTGDGGGEHLALWLLGENDAAHIWVGDLSGRALSAAICQQLLDDLVAVARSNRHRAFALLRPAETAKVIALSQSLVALDVSPADTLPASAADDAARMSELVSRLAEPLDNPLAGLRPTVTPQGDALSAALGDLARSRLIRVIPGNRLASLPTGQVRLWTSTAVAANRPEGVDLLALTSAYPRATLTAPDDVVFTGTGSPHAVVDAGGGSAVAFPARILRVSSTASCSPRAIAAVINALGTGRGMAKWRSWRVPIVSGNRREVEDLLRRIDAWEDQTRAQLDRIAELRRLATRSVTSGAVVFVPINEKGQ